MPKYRRLLNGKMTRVRKREKEAK